MIPAMLLGSEAGSSSAYTATVDRSFSSTNSCKIFAKQTPILPIAGVSLSPKPPGTPSTNLLGG